MNAFFTVPFRSLRGRINKMARGGEVLKSGTRKHSTTSQVLAILLVHVHDTELRVEPASRKYNHKFRTVNIPKLHHVPARDFFRFVLFSSLPAGTNSNRAGRANYEVRIKRSGYDRVTQYSQL